MTKRAARLMTWGLVLVALGCGKKGNPLPPLRPVPARITDLAATRSADRVELRFTVPAANLDGSTPAAVTRIDIFAVGVGAGMTAPAAGMVAADPRNLRSSLVVRRTTDTGDGTPASNGPAPGEAVVVVDRLQRVGDPLPETLLFVAVPVAGTGRGRSGPPSVPVGVPLGARPQSPADIVLTHDETTLRATWEPTAPGQVFQVVRVPAPDTAPESLAQPSGDLLQQPETTLPVEFGREICLAVRAVQVVGAVSVEGDLSRAACLTPVDRYPPPAPVGLQTVQDGAVVTLIWNPVDVADLAGYIVLRGVGDGDDLQPLMREPIRETTFRDTAVQAGASYTYAVYAVDNAPEPNISQLSVRQTVTVR